MNPLLIGAAFLLGPKLIGTSIAAKKLQFNPIGAKVISGQLNIIVSIINPAQTTVNIDALFLTCFLNIGDSKSKIGMITIPSGKSFQIAKLSTTTVNLPITLSGLGLVQITAQILTNLSDIKSGAKKVSVEVAGTVVSLGLSQTIDKTVPLDVSTITGM